MPRLKSLATSSNEGGHRELNMDESAELLDLCRGFDTAEISKRFRRVLPSFDEGEIQTCLLRFMGRGLINSDNERWYLMGKGEAVLWHYHEIKISLKLERSPDSLISRFRENLTPTKRKNEIPR